MSIQELSTDFKDDVLDTVANENRKYQMTYNTDGTVSFTDVTKYSQNGSLFGAKEVNEERTKINQLNKILSDKGKVAQTGNFGSQWKINQTYYYSIGGKEILNQDSELYTTRESRITVKKPGTYLAILHAYTFSTSGGGTLWGKITVNSAEKQTGAARCQGYSGIDLHCLLTLNANDVVDGLLSATGDITSEGKDTLTLIKLS